MAEQHNRLKNIYWDAVNDIFHATQQWPTYSSGFSVSKRSTWLYESVQEAKDVLGLTFEDLTRLDPELALKELHNRIRQSGTTGEQQTFYLESFAAGFSELGPMFND